MDDREEALRREIDQSVIRTGLHSASKQAEAAKYASEIRDLAEAINSLAHVVAHPALPLSIECRAIHTRLRILLGIEG